MLHKNQNSNRNSVAPWRGRSPLVRTVLHSPRHSGNGDILPLAARTAGTHTAGGSGWIGVSRPPEMGAAATASTSRARPKRSCKGDLSLWASSMKRCPVTRAPWSEALAMRHQPRVRSTPTMLLVQSAKSRGSGGRTPWLRVVSAVPSASQPQPIRLRPVREGESLFTPCRRGPTMKWQIRNEGALADTETRRVPQAEVPVGGKRNA